MKTEEELCDFLGKDLDKIGKLCRLCLSDNLSNAILISKDSEMEVDDVESLETKLNMDKELSLWEKIVIFGRVKVKYEDDLLKYICEECCYDIHVAYTFRIKCRKGQDLLRRVFRTLTGKEFESQYIEGKKEFGEMAVIDETKNIKEMLLDIKEERLDYHLDNSRAIEDELDCEDEKDNIVLPGNVKLKDENIEASPDTESSDNKNYKQYPCPECSKVLATKHTLSRHLKAVHSKEKNKDEIVSGSGSDKRYHCPDCEDKAFKTRQALRYHMATHTGARPFKCNQCEATFTQHGSLYSHKKTHSDKMYFTCPVCGKQFKTKGIFMRHCNIHKDSKYKCEMCNKPLKSKETLDLHMKRHLQIKNYSCEICGMSFVSKSEITNHMRHHNKKYTLQCTLCPFLTHSKVTLKNHILRHSGERPFKCIDCDFTAFTSGDLSNHRRKHSEEPMYPCPVCEIKFRHSKSVNKHMLSKHGKQFKWNDTVDRRFIK